MIKSTPFSLCTYILPIFLLLASIGSRIENVQWGFLWGGLGG